MSNTEKFKLFLALALPDDLVQYLKSKLDVIIAKSVPCTRQELLDSVKDVILKNLI